MGKSKKRSRPVDDASSPAPQPKKLKRESEGAPPDETGSPVVPDQAAAPALKQKKEKKTKKTHKKSDAESTKSAKKDKKDKKQPAAKDAAEEQHLGDEDQVMAEAVEPAKRDETPKLVLASDYYTDPGAGFLEPEAERTSTHVTDKAERKRKKTADRMARLAAAKLAKRSAKNGSAQEVPVAGEAVAADSAERQPGKTTEEMMTSSSQTAAAAKAERKRLKKAARMAAKEAADVTADAPEVSTEPQEDAEDGTESGKVKDKKKKSKKDKKSRSGVNGDSANEAPVPEAVSAETAPADQEEDVTVETESRKVNKKDKTEKRALKKERRETRKEAATAKHAAEQPKKLASGPDEGPDGTASADTGKTKKDRFIVFVGNLPFTATREDVMAHFAAVKPISVRLLTERDNPAQSRGIAFIEFDRFDYMKTCLSKFHHSECNDGKSAPRQINVELT